MTKAGMPQAFAHINSWVFDLDNTLYRADNAFFTQIVDNITKYISRYLALHPTDALILQKQYLAQYGTSLSGMMAVHGMDPADFLDYVHDVDMSFLKPDPLLYKKLEALPGKKYIFTNGSRGHAKNIGKHLGVYGLFDGVFAIEDMDYTPKPKRLAYEKFVTQYNIEPSHAFMAEDTALNLQVPKAMGMTTLLVGKEPNGQEPNGRANYVDHHSKDLLSFFNS